MQGTVTGDIAETRQPYADDVELVSRCLSGDEVARSELYRKHASMVHSLAWRLLGDPNEAEDVLQETFLQAFRSLSRYRGEAPIASWLRGVTVRCVGRYRRTRARRRRESRELPEVIIDPTTPDPARQIDVDLALRRLTALLSKLAFSRRVVFVLHEVEGYSLAEAAQILDISVSAAKKRVWRARHDLERLAQDDDVLSVLFSSSLAAERSSAAKSPEPAR
ncbi:MAG: RNA polymerase sigma factor [Myxococcales bacterium]|nr:RNA polymerase sigma factor [Myxococcales bacterium]